MWVVCKYLYILLVAHRIQLAEQLSWFRINFPMGGGGGAGVGWGCGFYSVFNFSFSSLFLLVEL